MDLQLSHDVVVDQVGYLVLSLAHLEHELVGVEDLGAFGGLVEELAVFGVELRFLDDEAVGDGVGRDELDGQDLVFGMLHIRQLAAHGDGRLALGGGSVATTAPVGLSGRHPGEGNGSTLAF